MADLERRAKMCRACWDLSRDRGRHVEGLDIGSWEDVEPRSKLQNRMTKAERLAERAAKRIEDSVEAWGTAIDKLTEKKSFKSATTKQQARFLDWVTKELDHEVRCLMLRMEKRWEEICDFRASKTD
jgi:hypothetical protein